jgi:serine protease Do
MPVRSLVLPLLFAALLLALAAPGASAQNWPEGRPRKGLPGDPATTEIAANDLEARLNPDERKLVQEALVWTGHYNGWIDGALGQGTRDAIRAFQRGEGYDVTGTLDPEQVIVLLDHGLTLRDSYEWTEITDRRSRIEIAYPATLLTEVTPDTETGGNTYADADGRAALITHRRTDAAHGAVMDILAADEAADNVEVGYEFKRTNLFILTGQVDGKPFYERFEQRGAEIRGYVFVWNPTRDQDMAAISVAMSNSFYPFGGREAAEPDYPTLAALVEAYASADPGTDTPPAEGTNRPESGAATPTGPEVIGTGTGFVITTDGYVLTNNHVIEGCAYLTFGAFGRIRIVSADPDRDLALLKIEHGFAQSILLRADPEPKLGEPVMAFGYPYRHILSESLNVTNGIVTSLAGIDNDRTRFQINAAVQPGNSGGPLVDQQGLLLGVVVARADDLAVVDATGTIPQNVNFAIRGPEIEGFLAQNGLKVKKLARSGTTSTQEIAGKLEPVVHPIECYGTPSAD